MSLIGDAIAHLPYVIHAIAEAGRTGVGPQRRPYLLEDVADATGDIIWCEGSNLAPVAPIDPTPRFAGARRLRVTIHTPLRLVREGCPITPESLDGPALGLAAVRRVGFLQDRFLPAAAPADFRRLKELSQNVALLDRELAWTDRRRFSNRQGRAITLGGFVGEATLDVGAAPELVPYLEACERLHIGKGATLGFGQISLAAA